MKRKLTPSHDHFELVLDPWHAEAFAGLPEVENAFAEGRGVDLSTGKPFVPSVLPRRKIWYSVDGCGNLIQEWGEDTPPGEN